MMSYWVYFVGGVTMLASFFQKGGAAQSGWTSYPRSPSLPRSDDVADRDVF